MIICLAQFYVAKKGGQPLERIQKCHSLPETVELIPLRNTDVQSTTAHILWWGRDESLLTFLSFVSFYLLKPFQSTQIFMIWKIGRYFKKLFPWWHSPTLAQRFWERKKLRESSQRYVSMKWMEKKKMVNNKHGKSKYFCHSFAHIVCSTIKLVVPKVNILFSLIFQLLESSIHMGWCTNALECVAKGVFSNASPFYILNNILLNFLLIIKVCFLLFPPFSCLLKTELQIK